MNHADVKKHLADYLEDDLSIVTRDRVDAHLDDCLECAREVEEMQNTIRLLQTLPEPETPPMIAANVMRRIRAGETQPNVFVRIGRVVSGVLDPTFVLPASAVAVAALVVMVIQDPTSLSRFVVKDTPVEPTIAATTPRAVAGATNGGNEIDVAGIDFLPLGSTQLTPSSAEPVTPNESRSTNRQTTFRYRFDFGQIAHGPVPNAATAYASPVLASRADSSRRGQGSGVSSYEPSSRPTQSFRVSERRGLAVAPTGSNGQRARRVAQSVRASASTLGSSSGEDPRDGWIARGLDEPIEFARFLASKNLAEQELWVSRLADRAEARGLLDDLIGVLRASGDAAAAILSDDFAAEIAAEAAPFDGFDDWDASFER